MQLDALGCFLKTLTNITIKTYLDRLITFNSFIQTSVSMQIASILKDVPIPLSCYRCDLCCDFGWLLWTGCDLAQVRPPLPASC